MNIDIKKATDSDGTIRTNNHSVIIVPWPNTPGRGRVVLCSCKCYVQTMSNIEIMCKND